MRFLRQRGDDLETARTSDRYTAKQKSDALNMLRGAVLILRHPYERDPYSGAGNCWCGRDETSALHHIVVDPTVTTPPTTEADR